MTAAAGEFLSRVPVLSQFSRTLDPALYLPVPDGWMVGLADVVNSTAAIAAGRYKVVNTCGASVIAAMSNALGGTPFAYAFGGDGASFVVAPDQAATASRVLAETAALARDELDLELRTALVPVSACRTAGHDLRLVFFEASPDLNYAMFSGGGLNWAEARMKAGEHLIAPAPSGSRPDLSGLSCRFEPVASERGVILSIIVLPAPGIDPSAFRATVEALLAAVDRSPEKARPLAGGSPSVAWPSTGLEIEARLSRRPGSALWARRLVLLVRSLLTTLIFRFRIDVGRFKPAAYLGQLVSNSDYRKYDDGLRMTIDCGDDLAGEIESRLDEAERAGAILYGVHRQASALITCYTPSPHRRDHVHFIDGAEGGYAAASLRLKAASSSSDANPQR